MKITVKRTSLGEKATIGQLLIDGLFFCQTLEDVVRPAGVKVQNQTAIPVGIYDLVIDQSTRFNRLMPHILNVPGFEGIRIHAGNTDKDTDGCILLGLDKLGEDLIGRSKLAFDQFFQKLQDGLKLGKATIEVI